MKAKIESQFPDAEIELIKGSKGMFDIHKDGTLIYSKYQSGRFPDPSEIVEQL